MNPELKIKICGITNAEDALAAAELGADYVGFVFAESKRRISPEAAARIAAVLPDRTAAVGVFRNAGEDAIRKAVETAGIGFIQLHGDEDPDLAARLGKGFQVIRRVDVRPEDDAASVRGRMGETPGCVHLLDPGAGDGAAFDWGRFRGIGRPFWLAGGLTPENVRRAVTVLNPAAVDVSSGVERAPGIKDREKMRKFMTEAR
jgi:phosphoribosylanthranilate isomerase